MCHFLLICKNHKPIQNKSTNFVTKVFTIYIDHMIFNSKLKETLFLFLVKIQTYKTQPTDQLINYLVVVSQLFCFVDK